MAEKTASPTTVNKNTEQVSLLVKHQCSICRIHFTEEETLKSHQQAVHRVSSSETIDDYYKCIDCNFPFQNFLKLISHRSNVHNETEAAQPIKGKNDSVPDEFKYWCTQCEEFLNSVGELKTHLQFDHKVLSKKCFLEKQSNLPSFSTIKQNKATQKQNKSPAIMLCKSLPTFLTIHPKDIQISTSTSTRKKKLSKNIRVDSDESVLPTSDKDLLSQSTSEIELDVTNPVFSTGKDKSISQIEGGKWLCSLCDKTFATKKYCIRHQRLVHRVMTLKSEDGFYKCSDCDVTVRRHIHLIYHLISEHGVSIKFEEKQFETDESFQTWKSKVEKESMSSYILNYRHKVNGFPKCKYICHRQGQYHNKVGDGRKRKMKRTGTCKTGFACPSFMETSEENGKIGVKFYKTHHGHGFEPEHIKYHKDDCQNIAELLKKQFSKKDIIAQLKATEDEKLKKIKSKDIFNIVRRFKLKDVISSNNEVESSYCDIATLPYLNEESRQNLKVRAIEQLNNCIELLHSCDDLEMICRIKNTTENFNKQMIKPVKRKAVKKSAATPTKKAKKNTVEEPQFAFANFDDGYNQYY